MYVCALRRQCKRIELPGDTKAEPHAGGARIIVHPRHRTPLRIDITPDAAPGSDMGSSARTRALAPALQISFHEQVLPGGSGGDDHVLDGVLHVASTAYRVSCSQQSEWQGSEHACLPILASLRSTSLDPKGKVDSLVGGAHMEDVSKLAQREFELVPSEYVGGTSKLYSRGDFLPLDDPKAMSEGDFIGRLRALFEVYGNPRPNDPRRLRLLPRLLQHDRLSRSAWRSPRFALGIRSR